MSIVEKALQKLQASREREPRPTPVDERRPVVIGTLVHPPAGPHRPDTTPPAKTVRVNRDALRESGILPPAAQEREFAHQYRAIKRPLVHNALQPTEPGAASGRVIMLASALPGEGKTFTSINLALSLSLEKDHGVLLIDADVAKPHVSRLFGVEREPGLLDVVADTTTPIDTALRSLVIGTDVPRLTILPAGHAVATSAELLASGRMREVVQRLAAIYPDHIILFDSSPILLTSEARVLASLVGQVVLLVTAGRTPQHALKDAVSAIENQKKISLMLNQATTNGALDYYYGYGYGQEYGSDSAPEPK